jgi:AcrR family transcriptional regulator
MKNQTALRDRSDTGTAILEAARDLLAETGLEALSMRAVARRVGVSATAIYHYFENKEALVRSVVDTGYQRMEGYLQRATRPHPLGSRERLRALGEAYVRFALENREYFKVLFTLEMQRPQRLEESPEGGGYRLLLETVAQTMDSGAIRRADPELVAFHLWAYVHGLVNLLLAYPAATGEGAPDVVTALELLQRLRPLLRDGLAPDADGS